MNEFFSRQSVKFCSSSVGRCLMPKTLFLLGVQASTSGNVAVMNLLLKKGADVAVTDKDGVTTLMSAASHGHASVRSRSCYFR